MTLPAVPPIGMIEIQQEFLAPLGTPLSAFLRGGAWVPDTPTNAGVPTVLPIAMTDLLGASIDQDTIDQFVMVSGTDAMSGDTGYDDNNGFGSLTPDTYLGGFYEVLSLQNGQVLVVRVSGIVLAADAWTEIQFVTGTNWAGESFLSSEFVYDNPGGGADSRWERQGAHADFANGATYDVNMISP